MDLRLLESVAPPEPAGAPVAPPAPKRVGESVSLEQLTSSIYAALKAKLGDAWATGNIQWQVVATFSDAVVVQRAGELLKYPVIVDPDGDWDGDVALGDPVECTAEYPNLTPAAVTEAKESRLRAACAVSLKESIERAREGVLILGPIQEGTSKAKPGSVWGVVVIQEGLSANKRLYTRKAIQEAAPLFEGSRVYWNHLQPGESTMRNPLNIAGFLTKPTIATIEGKAAIVAQFNATDKRARTFLKEAFDAGNPNLVGLSIDASGIGEAVKTAEGTVMRVDRITKAHSVDIVAEPAAGGRFTRLVAGMPSSLTPDKELEMLDQKIKKLLESAPHLHKLLSASPSESEVDALLRVAEAVPATGAATGTDGKPVAPAIPVTTAPAAPTSVKEALGLNDDQVKEMRQAFIESKVEKQLAGRTLPDARKPLVKQTMLALREAGASEADISKYLDDEVKLAAQEAESLGSRGAGVGRTLEVRLDEADKALRALDGLFAEEDIKEGTTVYPRYRSIREAYIQITGDTKVSGTPTRVTEAALRRFEGALEAPELAKRGIHLTEAITTTSFSNVLASSLNRRLVAEYNAKAGAYGDTGKGWLWRSIPVSDFRSQVRVRFGGYGNLPTVGQTNTYQPLTEPTDETFSYSVTKYGGLETLSWEAIRNDDVGFVVRIPQRMALAARRTLYEFAHNLYITNPAYGDGHNVFDASNHQGNLGTAPLSKTAWAAAQVNTRKVQEKDSGKRLGLTLQHLMVPAELQETAFDMFRMVALNGAPANFEPDYVQAQLNAMIHVIAHATDSNDWYACAGIDQGDQIEIGFLDGREDPEIFVADLQNAGSLFNADKIDYKIRHPYGGTLVDYRLFYASTPAGA